MSYEAKPGSGVLFKNDRKEKDTHPDYKGSINIDGVDHWLSAWIKDGKNGKFMSLSVGQPKGEKAAPAAAADTGGGFDDDIPFMRLPDSYCY